MSSVSGRCNSAERGSAKNRRARRLWLLTPEAGWGGDGVDVPCWTCGVLLEYVDIFVDRIIPGEREGRYWRCNIAPHCQLCSCRQGQVRTTVIRFAGERELAPGERLPGYPPYFEPMLDSG